MKIKFVDFYIHYNEETFNTKIYATVYSESSKETYKLEVELDENELKIIKFDCTCKGVTIPKSLNKPYKMCKHLKTLKSILELMGYLNG